EMVESGGGECSGVGGSGGVVVGEEEPAMPVIGSLGAAFLPRRVRTLMALRVVSLRCRSLDRNPWRTGGKDASGGRAPGRPTAFIFRSLRGSSSTYKFVAFPAAGRPQIPG